jgi:hypothetical protein
MWLAALFAPVSRATARGDHCDSHHSRIIEQKQDYGNDVQPRKRAQPYPDEMLRPPRLAADFRGEIGREFRFGIPMPTAILISTF